MLGARPTRGGLTYQPALDGLRGLAVAFVLAFHLELSWASGGYLGVSVFFTLSGFLITSLLVNEYARTRRIDVVAFYGRRIRRLLPAAAVCLAAIAGLTMIGVFAASPGDRADLLSAALDVANWRALLAHESYTQLFAAPSPVAHFWSLAIEEQFYIVWPLVLSGLLVWRGGRDNRQAGRRRVVFLFVAFTVAAVVTAVVGGADAAYYASWARFPEILSGAALAIVLSGRSVPARAQWLAPVCLGLIAVLCVVTPAEHGWAYRGGLPAFSLLTVGLLAGLQVDGPVTRLLSWRPLVALGVISYGVYLFHWPVFVAVDSHATFPAPVQDALKLALTVGLATVSYVVVERPIRFGALWATSRRLLPVGFAAASVSAVAAVALVVPSAATRSASPLVLAATGRLGLTASPAAADAGQTTPVGDAVSARAASKTIAVFGDSVPDWLIRDAGASYSRPDFTVIDAAHAGCDGAVDSPPARTRTHATMKTPKSCHPWTASYPSVVEDPTKPVDVALLMVGQAPEFDRLINHHWVSPCQTMSWYVSDVAARIRYLRAHVANVVLALPSWASSEIRFYLPSDFQSRYACIRDQLSTLAYSLDVPIVDLARILCPHGPREACAPYRTQDGLHVDPNDAQMVLNWVLDQVAADVKTESAQMQHGE